MIAEKNYVSQTESISSPQNQRVTHDYGSNLSPMKSSNDHYTSQRVSRGSNGSNGLYNTSSRRSARRSTRVSQTGSIGFTKGVNRSPKRVIAAEEPDSHTRGFSPSPDKPVTERVTIYEKDPVHVPSQNNIPNINMSPRHNRTMVSSIVNHTS